MKCDFCSNPFPVWQYPVRAGTPWAACSECAALIDAGEILALARRAVRTLLVGAGRKPAGWMVEITAALQETFWSIRAGGRRPYTAPAPPPAAGV